MSVAAPALVYVCTSTSLPAGHVDSSTPTESDARAEADVGRHASR